MTRTDAVRTACLALLLTVQTGCGGDDDRPIGDAGGAAGSGIASGREVRSLGRAEIASLCEWAVEQAGGGGATATCDGTAVYVQTVSECESTLAAVTCAITVGTVEQCWVQVADDLCAFLTHEDCGELVACAD